VTPVTPTSSRILVTGATGVIGRRVVPLLLARGDQVSAVGRNPAKLAPLTKAGATPLTLDLFDASAVRRAVDGHDVVINLATHMPSSTFKMMFARSWRENDRVRREGSALLVDAALAAGVGRFIQESFAPVYDDHGDQWIDEQWSLRPVSYNRTVLDAEGAAARFSAGGGTGVVLRFAGFYGPDALLGDLLKVVRRGWSPIPGRSDAYWSAVSHDDAAAAVVAAVSVPAGIYNVCDDEPLTRRELADALARAANARAANARPPRLMPSWVAGLGGTTMELLSRSQRMSNAKLKAASTWAPRWANARDGLFHAARELEQMATNS
jgi:nucleoside-diphosphate-sugar epimerase